MNRKKPCRPKVTKRSLPRSFKDLTPSRHFAPRKFFHEMVVKALLTRRTGHQRTPVFPQLREGKIAITWIGHASFLIQFNDLNVLIDPNFANWLFLLKRLKVCGFRLEHLPPIDLVLLTHAHYDHFHKPTLRRLPHPGLGIMPWGMWDLARSVGFARVVELEWWESFSHRDWKVTLTPANHWGARTLRDHHRGYGGFVLEHQGRRIYHAGDTAYFEGFKEIGEVLRPEIALLPIGAYYPETFRHVHMGPDQALKAFQDLRAKRMVPMHFGAFRLGFEDMEEPPRWLMQLASEQGLSRKICVLEEGDPRVF